MKSIAIDISHALFFAGQQNYEALIPDATAAISQLNDGSGPGADFTGWVSLPSDIPVSLIDDIKSTAKTLRNQADYIVCIGIGGSYLGAKAVVEALSDPFASLYQPSQAGPRLLFAGQNISGEYSKSLLTFLEGKRFAIIVISKSGTTTEPAIAFRLLRDRLVESLGVDKARSMIVAITDASKGALHTMAVREGYKTFVIPDNVGGRFSVLTPVGLLPIAAAGFDIDKILDGARLMQQTTLHAGPSNPAQTYATIRNALYHSGKKIELLVNFDPRLHYFAEWWKQLYGESEGKQGKGIFPAAADFTTDLHSMGQYIQDGERTLFETLISVEEPSESCLIPTDSDDTDGLNYIAGRTLHEVNAKAELGTVMAHVDGGVPLVRISVPKISEHTLGQLIYFFEKACGISGYILGVNPFDQPGVEAYKRNMFRLLGKPGY